MNPLWFNKYEILSKSNILCKCSYFILLNIKLLFIINISVVETMYQLPKWPWKLLSLNIWGKKFIKSLEVQSLRVHCESNNAFIKKKTFKQLWTNKVTFSSHYALDVAVLLMEIHTAFEIGQQNG